MKVVLQTYEVRMATYVGVERRLQVLFDDMKKQNYVGNKKWEPWGTDIEAAGAECAVAKLLNIYWRAAA